MQIPTNSRPLQVKCLVDVAVRREKIVHDDEVDLPAIRHLDAVQTIELRDQGVRVLLDVLIVFGQNFPQDLVFGVVNGLDDIFVVSREVEEATTFTRRAQFGEDILAGKGHEVVGRVKTELCP